MYSRAVASPVASMTGVTKAAVRGPRPWIVSLARWPVRGARAAATLPSPDSTGLVRRAGPSSAMVRTHAMADGPAVLAAICPLKTSAVMTESAIAPARNSSPSTSRGQPIQRCGVSS